MQIVVTDKIREFEFTKEEGGGKLFFNLLPQLEYYRIYGSPENIALVEKNRTIIDIDGLSEEEIEKLELKENIKYASQLILNNATVLICDTNVITGWEDFHNDKGEELKFSQESLKQFIGKCCSIGKINRIVMAITDNFYAVKKKEISKQKKKKQKTNTKNLK